MSSSQEEAEPWPPQPQGSENEDSESQEVIVVEEGQDEGHRIHHHGQLVDFHTGRLLQSGDFGPDEVIEVVHIQHDPDNDNPQEVRVLHFPISALTNASHEYEQVEGTVDVGVEDLPPLGEEIEPETETQQEQVEQVQENPEQYQETQGVKVEKGMGIEQPPDVKINPIDEEESLSRRRARRSKRATLKAQEILKMKVEASAKSLEGEKDNNQGLQSDAENPSAKSNPVSPQVLEPDPEPEPEPFPTDRCANCTKSFGEEEERVSKISRNGDNSNLEVKALMDPNQEDSETSAKEDKDVSNIDALHLIFQLPKEVQREGDECVLCGKCAKILIDLYSAYKNFTELAAEEAYVAKKLKEMTEVSKAKKGKRRKQADPKKFGLDNSFSYSEIKAEVEWEEEDDDDELLAADFSDDEDFQASESELAAAGVESSSSSSDDEMYIPVKKKKLVKQLSVRPKKSADGFWDNDIKQEPYSDDEFDGQRNAPKRSRNKKCLLTGLTYDCNLCSESFLKPRALRQHLQEFHKKTHRSFDPLQEKPEEGDPLLIIPNLTEEEEIPSASDLKVEEPTNIFHPCRLCLKEFETRGDLKDHFMEDHEGEMPYKCEKCGRQFWDTAALKRHEISHTAEKPYKCRVCLSAFRRADELRAHWTGEHVVQQFLSNNDDEGPSSKRRRKGENKKKKGKKVKVEKNVVPCEICGKAFARHDHLKLHIRIHTGEKPYKCTACGKAFSDPRGLAYHEVTHSNERPYCCIVCGMTFKRLHHLNDHERNHRDDIERPFACETCGKCFKYKKHLNSHMVIHGNSKDHQCEVCGKAFNRKDNLRQHVKKVHGKEPGPSTMSFVVTPTQLLATTNASAIVTQALPLDASLDQIVYMHL